MSNPVLQRPFYNDPIQYFHLLSGGSFFKVALSFRAFLFPYATYEYARNERKGLRSRAVAEWKISALEGGAMKISTLEEPQ